MTWPLKEHAESVTGCIVQVLAVVSHADQTGVVAPVGQLDVRDRVMDPVCPMGHATVSVWGAQGIHVTDMTGSDTTLFPSTVVQV